MDDEFVNEGGLTQVKHKVMVAYLCWGCGAVSAKYEEINEPEPSREVWNLCPDCIKKKEKGVIKEIKNGR